MLIVSSTWRDIYIIMINFGKQIITVKITIWSTEQMTAVSYNKTISSSNSIRATLITVYCYCLVCNRLSPLFSSLRGLLCLFNKIADEITYKESRASTTNGSRDFKAQGESICLLSLLASASKHMSIALSNLMLGSRGNLSRTNLFCLANNL